MIIKKSVNHDYNSHFAVIEKQKHKCMMNLTASGSGFSPISD